MLTLAKDPSLPATEERDHINTHSPFMSRPLLLLLLLLTFLQHITSSTSATNKLCTSVAHPHQMGDQALPPLPKGQKRSGDDAEREDQGQVSEVKKARPDSTTSVSTTTHSDKQAKEKKKKEEEKEAPKSKLEEDLRSLLLPTTRKSTIALRRPLRPHKRRACWKSF